MWRPLTARWFAGLALLVLVPAQSVVWACGGGFPNRLLVGGDEVVLSAPVAVFRLEIDRITPPEEPPFKAAPPQDIWRPWTQTADAGAADLRSALREAGVDRAEEKAIVAGYGKTRGALQEHVESVVSWRRRWWNRSRGPRPKLGEVAVPDGIPREFDDYLRGAIAYRQERTGDARSAWEALLEAPARERKYRSTWAAFMLGKTWLKDDPAKAATWFRKVRELAEKGLADSLGLAAASYGWEAKTELDEGRFVEAIKLYLVQHASGDRTAAPSLRDVASRLLASNDAEELRLAAADPFAQQVLTAFIVSGDQFYRGQDLRRVEEWLGAVERQGCVDVKNAARLGWAAYQRGRIGLARRWLDRADPDSQAAQWLRAKLLLRDGELDDAAELLEKAGRSARMEGRWLTPPITRRYYHGTPNSRLPDKLHGELGVVQLARGKYTDALDAFLKGRHGYDAAYVAERVLTPEELIAYVDENWSEEEEGKGEWNSSAKLIRLTLGKRLARLERWDEASRYFPKWLRCKLDALADEVRTGRDEKLPVPARAASLRRAAEYAYSGGRSLLWEYEAYFFSRDGSNPEWATSVARLKPDETRLFWSGPDERERLRRHRVLPENSLRHRYVAADLAWEATKLMPDNSEETARVLCVAGSWIKHYDPGAADRFYKAMVVRNPETSLGREAHRLRWFPKTTERSLSPQAGSDRPETADARGPAPSLKVTRIVIKKKARTLEAYSGDRLVRSCRVGLGSVPVGDKEREGDGRTPEGSFYVCTKNPLSKYFLSVGLSYPNEEDARRGLRDGLITQKEHDQIASAIRKRVRPPWKTALGGEICIHGRGSGRDWTRGCIALDDQDMQELYEAVHLRTPVEILP